MLRAGPFSDARLQAVINQRFIPFYLDLNPHGFVSDAPGREFVIRLDPTLKGHRVPTPPVLIATPGGKLLGQVSNYADADRMLATLLEVAAKHPGTRQPSHAEAADPLLHATVLSLLGEREQASVLLDQAENRQPAETRLVRARLARWHGEPEQALQMLADTEDGAAERLETAWIHWSAGQPAQVLQILEDVEDETLRSEARYLAGLAMHAEGEVAAAQAVWKSVIEESEEGPWVYRADWAWVATGGGSSLLKRHGYMGSSHPDLAHPEP